MLAFLAAFSLALLAPPKVLAQDITCAPAVNGTLQLVMPDNEDITRTGASFAGPDYIVNGVEAKLLKIFAPEDVFYFNVCNSTFMEYEQIYSEYGVTFLYGQLQDVTSGLCVTASQLGDFVTTEFYASDCSVLDNESQLYQFFRIEIQPTAIGAATRDPQPTISFIGVPSSDNPDGAEQYSYTYDRATLAAGDTLPDVVGSNPRTDDSELGFFAPEYYF